MLLLEEKNKYQIIKKYTEIQYLYFINYQQNFNNLNNFILIVILIFLYYIIIFFINNAYLNQ